jgi:DNA-binding transcriptional regulator YdaS (Cro superfamily)
MRTEQAVEYFGSQAAIAAALEISRAAVSKWGDVVPEGSAYKLESLTDGELKVDRDLYRRISAAG